jgi:hypothetical protein
MFGAATAKYPQAREGPSGDAAPDAEAAVPDRQWPPPMWGHRVPARRQVVTTATDEARGNGQDRDLLHQLTIAAFAFPTA